jgi:hypothetical protein
MLYILDKFPNDFPTQRTMLQRSSRTKRTAPRWGNQNKTLNNQISNTQTTQQCSIKPLENVARQCSTQPLKNVATHLANTQA